ncbi:PLP-dependent aminotransferase family protein [Pendulispora rubella]|uniref:PLP-dependent aminotransferase family protein n=1 Tax=Pendulispora rubella TaxID=2741070 RepID=A0ABZ2L7T7_9BACT
MQARRVAQHWLTLDGDGALQTQIVRALRTAILRGELPPGHRLPSTRTLARELEVSRTTSQHAYEQLLTEGYLEARRGSATRVASTLDPVASTPDEAAPPSSPALSAYGQRLSEGAFGYPYRAFAEQELARFELLYGLPDHRAFPLDAWRKALTDAARHATPRALSYGEPEGTESLRQAIARHILSARGVRCHPDQIIVVAGVQQALALVARLLLDPGDRVVLEEPGYLGARAAFASAGARLVPAPVDEQGIDVTAVPRRTRCRLVYVTPSHQFPTGRIMSLSRRQMLLSWAAGQDACIFEDDYDGELRYEGRPIETLYALDGGHRVIFAGTFSKTLFPSLRIGYIVVPPSLVDVVRAAKWTSDWSCPNLEQVALTSFIESGDFARHLRRSRLRYASKRRALLEELTLALGGLSHQVDWQVGGGAAGLHIVLWLPKTSPRELARIVVRARALDVGIYSIAPYYLGEPRSGLLIGYGLLDEASLREAIRRLGRAIRADGTPRAAERRPR